MFYLEEAQTNVGICVPNHNSIKKPIFWVDFQHLYSLPLEFECYVCVHTYQHFLVCACYLRCVGECTLLEKHFMGVFMVGGPKNFGRSRVQTAALFCFQQSGVLAHQALPRAVGHRCRQPPCGLPHRLSQKMSAEGSQGVGDTSGGVEELHPVTCDLCRKEGQS